MIRFIFNDDFRSINHERRGASPSNFESSHDLMQKNYYDQAHFTGNYASSPSKKSSERGSMNIDIKVYKEVS